VVDSGERYDLVVFDRVGARRLPGIGSITFGGVPAGVEATPDPPQEGRRLLSWLRQHPLLRYVSLDELVYSGFGGYQPPAGAATLAQGPDGPVIIQLGSRGARHVCVGFPLQRSNWPVQVSFTVFMANVIDHLTLAGTAAEAASLRPGEPLAVRARSDVHELRVTGPQSATVSVEPGGLAALPALERSGLYEIEGAASRFQRLAVSLLSDIESDIRPRSTLMVNARPVHAGAGAGAAARELWPWLVAAAGLLIVVEWLTYCSAMSR
jgi:hypothetical protein